MERRRVAKKNSYFLKKMETLPVEAIKALQFEKTKETLERAYHKSPFYRDLFDKARVKPERFRKLEDIGRFPFIEKQDLVKDQQEHPLPEAEHLATADQRRLLASSFSVLREIPMTGAIGNPFQKARILRMIRGTGWRQKK